MLSWMGKNKISKARQKGHRKSPAYTKSTWVGQVMCHSSRQVLGRLPSPLPKGPPPSPETPFPLLPLPPPSDLRLPPYTSPWDLLTPIDVSSPLLLPPAPSPPPLRGMAADRDVNLTGGTNRAIIPPPYYCERMCEGERVRVAGRRYVWFVSYSYKSYTICNYENAYVHMYVSFFLRSEHFIT